MRHPLILLLARLGHQSRALDPVRLADARAVNWMDALAAIEAYAEDARAV
jgi:hypothetical protein